MKKILHVKDEFLNSKDISATKIALVIIAIYGIIFTVTYIAW